MEFPGAARFLSGLALFLAAWLLLKTWIIRDRWATPLVPYLFALSGVSTALSGARAVAIAAYPASEIGIASGNIAEAAEVLSGLRWVTGRIGFVAAGLAVIVAARYQAARYQYRQASRLPFPRVFQDLIDGLEMPESGDHPGGHSGADEEH